MKKRKRAPEPQHVILRPGQIVQFVITAVDTTGRPMRGAPPHVIVVEAVPEDYQKRIRELLTRSRKTLKRRRLSNSDRRKSLRS